MKENNTIENIKNMPWHFLGLILVISCMGVALLYSAAGGDVNPWAIRQFFYMVAGFVIMFAIALVDIRFWLQKSYYIYFFGIALLLLVHLIGVKGGLGAQRWLNIGGFQFQPSELMKVCIVLALARYYHMLHPTNVNRIFGMVMPIILVAIAAGLILKQPNLGTAVIALSVGAIILFMAGVSWKKFAVAAVAVIAMLPIVWSNMHDYQKRRVHTFIDPESDPLGSGYNIIQSKIAVGSGGFLGKGFTKGTQTQLSFVPEKQTDFIFSILSEEFGFVGSFTVLALYFALIISALRIAIFCKSTYARLVSSGAISILFIHIAINVGMVLGLLPVVGVPLPLLSYGGSSMLSTFIGFGFILNAHIHRDTEISAVG